MKTFLFIICTICISQSLTTKKFEGELVYQVNWKNASPNYRPEVIKILVKNKNLISISNIISNEKSIVFDSLRKLYVIANNPFKKEDPRTNHKDFPFMVEIDLDYNGKYNDINSALGEIISITKNDTTLYIGNENHELSKLFVKRKYGKETYVYSESENQKLWDNRNIAQRLYSPKIYTSEIANHINNSIIYYCKVSSNKEDVPSSEYKLVEISSRKIPNKLFNIPKHKYMKGYKKKNRNNKNKYYKIIE